MRIRMRPGLAGIIVAATVIVSPSIAGAQQVEGDASRPEVMSALLRDIAGVEEKLVSLAEAIPEERYGWRPGEGARSVSEVLVHIAADNWFLPTAVGAPAPDATGIKAGDYPSVQAYEARAMNKAEALATMRESFAHLRAVMEQADGDALAQRLNLFGSEMGVTDLWVLTTTHLHEHLGQLIAYARSNEIVPPWSR